MCLNTAKTEFLLLGFKPQLNKIHNIALVFSNGHFVPPIPLFATFVSFLILISHSPTKLFCLSCMQVYHIPDLRRIRLVLDFDTARITGTSFVYSGLDYCNAMYYCLPKAQLSRFQDIQNVLARAVVATLASSNSDHILRSLHWLKPQEHIEYNIVSTTYKLLQLSSARYLRNLITVQPSQSTRYGHWSLVSLFQPPNHSNLNITNRSFRHAAPHL